MPYFVRRLSILGALLLATTSAFAQKETKDQEEFNAAITVLGQCYLPMRSGDYRDLSDKFPATPSGLFVRDIYRCLRGAQKADYDGNARINGHRYREILVGEGWNGKPVQALAELKASAAACREARSKIVGYVDQMAVVVKPAAGDSEPIKNFKAGTSGTFAAMRSGKWTSLALWSQRLVLISRLQAKFEFLKKYRGKYDAFGLSVYFHSDSLESRYRKLDDSVWAASNEIVKIMNKAREIDPFGRSNSR